MVFIESRSFTRRLLALGKGSPAALNAIQADLLDNPERGRLVPGLGGIRKARASNPKRGKESAAASDISTFILSSTSRFTCSTYSTRTSRKT